MRVLIAITVAAALFAAAAQAQQVYRWVDEDGVVHYSDQPHDGAERVDLRAVQGYESTFESRPEAFDPAADDAVADEALAYTSIRIVSPPDGEPVWATGGGLEVEVETVPALQPGHRIALTLNGTDVPGTPVASTRITVGGLIRGEHTLQAAVVDADGYQQIFSQEITFNVLQASLNQPRRQ